MQGQGLKVLYPSRSLATSQQEEDGRTGKTSSSLHSVSQETHSSGHLVADKHCNIVPYFSGYFGSFRENFSPPQRVSDDFPDLLIVLLPYPCLLWEPYWHLGGGWERTDANSVPVL